MNAVKPFTASVDGAKLEQKRECTATRSSPRASTVCQGGAG